MDLWYIQFRVFRGGLVHPLDGEGSLRHVKVSHHTLTTPRNIIEAVEIVMVEITSILIYRSHNLSLHAAFSLSMCEASGDRYMYILCYIFIQFFALVRDPEQFWND